MNLARIRISPGDVVMVTGRWSTIAVAREGLPITSGRHLIQIDGTLREYPGRLGREGAVKRVAAAPPETGLLAPTEVANYGP